METPRVSYFYEPEIGKFTLANNHIMKPHRLNLLHQLVLQYGLNRNMQIYRPYRATKEDMCVFHDPNYVGYLETGLKTEESEYTDLDTPFFEGVFDYCSMYAGASIEGAVHLNKGISDISINWSGGMHHAQYNKASGFCYVNDIVLAILELLKCYQNVLYIDIDIHHGDGVQNAFYLTNRVMTISFHKYDANFFPQSGHLDETGADEGLNYSVNVPLKNGIDDESYFYIFSHVIRMVTQYYQPNCIVLQCGADSLADDYLGSFTISIKCHGQCVNLIKQLGLPLLILGGGGYTVQNAARCWVYETSILVDKSLESQIPYNDYLEYYAPDFNLFPEIVPKFKNQNTRNDLNYILCKIQKRFQ